MRPSFAEGVDFPVHVLAVRALGLPLLDYLALEDLAAACHATGRWTFLRVVTLAKTPWSLPDEPRWRVAR